MNISNVVICDYNLDYNKFLKQIKNNKNNYSIKFFLKHNQIKSLENFEIFKKKLINKNIKIIIFCSKKSLKIIMENIDFFVSHKIKIVQASTNYEVENHGFIIRKPFKDFSFDELFLRKTLKINKGSIKKILKNKKIVITGGAGSIGSYLVKTLIKFNVKKIFIIDNSEHNVFKLINEIDENTFFNKIKFKILNIENLQILNKYLKNIKANIVFHTAALKHVNFLENNISQAVETNIIGTENILKCSYDSGVKYFIHISTDKAADPKNNLGISKLISEIKCEKYINKKNMKIAIVRFGNVFNSNGSVAERFKTKLLKVRKIVITDPNVSRYFMSGTEAANLIISALEIIYNSRDKLNCRTFVCDMGDSIKIKDIAKKMIFLSGRSTDKYLSKRYSGLFKGEKKEEVLISKNEQIIRVFNKKILEIKKKRSYKKVINYDFKKILNFKNEKYINTFIRGLFN